MTKEDLDFIKAHKKAYDGVVLDLLNHIDELERKLALKETAQ